MKLPLSWLKDFVNIDDIQPKELADKLLNIGFEVEEQRGKWGETPLPP